MRRIAQVREEFSWDADGWFGIQLGATVWIALSALMILRESPGSALVLTGFFLAPNLIGATLWYSRKKLSAYAAIQLYTLLAGLCSLASVYVIKHAGFWHLVQGFGGTYSAEATFVMVAVTFALVMLTFHVRFSTMR